MRLMVYNFWRNPFLTLLMFSITVQSVLAVSETEQNQSALSNTTESSIIAALNYRDLLAEISLNSSISFFHSELEEHKLMVADDSIAMEIDKNFIKQKIIFSSVLNGYPAQQQEFLKRILASRIIKARTRSQKDQERIDLVLRSDNFRIKLNTRDEMPDPTAYAVYSHVPTDLHTILFNIKYFTSLDATVDSEPLIARSVEKMICAFGHAMDTLQNLNGIMTNKARTEYRWKDHNKWRHSPVLAFQSHEEYLRLKNSLDEDEKNIYIFGNLIEKSKNGRLSRKESDRFSNYTKLLEEYYNPKIQEIFVENPSAEKFKEGTRQFMTVPLDDKVSSPFYPISFEKRTEEGYLISGLLMEDPKIKKTDLPTIFYRDFLAHKKSLVPTYKKLYQKSLAIASHESPHLENYRLANERFASLRETHPAIILAFFPKTMAIENVRKEQFQQRQKTLEYAART